MSSSEGKRGRFAKHALACSAGAGDTTTASREPSRSPEGEHRPVTRGEARERRVRRLPREVEVAEDQAGGWREGLVGAAACSWSRCFFPLLSSRVVVSLFVLVICELYSLNEKYA
jgi:hypothetical protein